MEEALARPSAFPEASAYRRWITASAAITAIVAPAAATPMTPYTQLKRKRTSRLESPPTIWASTVLVACVSRFMA